MQHFSLACNVSNCRVPFIIAPSITTKTSNRKKYIYTFLDQNFNTTNFQHFNSTCFNIVAIQGYMALILTGRIQSKVACRISIYKLQCMSVCLCTANWHLRQNGWWLTLIQHNNKYNNIIFILYFSSGSLIVSSC